MCKPLEANKLFTSNTDCFYAVFFQGFVRVERAFVSVTTNSADALELVSLGPKLIVDVKVEAYFPSTKVHASNGPL